MAMDSSHGKDGRQQCSSAAVLTRTAQDTFEKKKRGEIPNNAAGSAARLARRQRSNKQQYRRKSKLEKHICSENLKTPNH
jgi:hypothetical protein